MKYPKECIISECRNVFYVEFNELHLPLQCEECIEKRNKKYNN